jgi:hypothetical protein
VVVTVIAVPSVGHIEVAVVPMPSGGDIDGTAVPMPVPLTDVNSDAADPDIDGLRDDHWFVAGVRGTGKCRHRQEWNNKKRKQSILHGTLLGWGRTTSRYPPRCALGTSEVCIGLTSTAL